MAEDTHSFDAARVRLEEIAAQVRKKDTSLEKSLDLLEEGVRLANLCTEQIDHTQWKSAVAEQPAEGSDQPAADAEMPLDGAPRPEEAADAADDGDRAADGEGEPTDADGEQPAEAAVEDANDAAGGPDAGEDAVAEA